MYRIALVLGYMQPVQPNTEDNKEAPTASVPFNRLLSLKRLQGVFWGARRRLFSTGGEEEFECLNRE
jgi:hypothetical protein